MSTPKTKNIYYLSDEEVKRMEGMWLKAPSNQSYKNPKDDPWWYEPTSEIAGESARVGHYLKATENKKYGHMITLDESLASNFEGDIVTEIGYYNKDTYKALAYLVTIDEWNLYGQKAKEQRDKFVVERHLIEAGATNKSFGLLTKSPGRDTSFSRVEGEVYKSASSKTASPMPTAPPPKLSEAMKRLREKKGGGNG